MTLADIWRMVFHRDLAQAAPSDSTARQEWREEIHANRNEATKAIAMARISERVSKGAEERLQEANDTLRGKKSAPQIGVDDVIKSLLERLDDE